MAAPKVEVMRNAIRDPQATATTWWRDGGGGALSVVADSDDGDGSCIQFARSSSGSSSYALPVKSTTPSTANGWLACEAGDTILGLASAKAVSIGSGTFNTVRNVFAFYDSGGSWIQDISGDSVTPEVGAWNRLADVVTAPENAAFVIHRAQFGHSSSDDAVMRFDRHLLAVVDSSTEADPNLFFSGSGYVDADGVFREDTDFTTWTGTPNESVSTLNALIRFNNWSTGIWHPTLQMPPGL